MLFKGDFQRDRQPTGRRNASLVRDGHTIGNNDETAHAEFLSFKKIYTWRSNVQEGERVSDADDPTDAKIVERVQLARGAATAAPVSKPFQALVIRGAWTNLDKWRVCRRWVMISAQPHFHAPGGSCPLNTKGRPEPPFHHQGFGSYERFLELRLSI
ncbi:hypothetical protein EME01_20600 [Sinorhizobium meliloti]|nr:hypothetical protein EME01_20600 [Sinorhizobium meliloti]